MDLERIRISPMGLTERCEPSILESHETTAMCGLGSMGCRYRRSRPRHGEASMADLIGLNICGR